MKLLNNTEKDLMIPVRMPRNNSGVYQVINHLTVRKGESEDIPEHAVKGAKLMGMTEGVKALESSIGKVKVETKKIEDESKEELSDEDPEKKLWDMNAKEQKSMLKELGAEKIPRYEKDRVALILKLQENK